MNLQKYKSDIAGVVWGYCGIRVYHAYARFYNFGDNALAYGVKNVFQQYFSPYIRYKNSDVHSTIYNRRTINKINSWADLFLIGGGGLIHSSGKHWMFNMPNSDVWRMRRPMVFYGLGYNNFTTDTLCAKTRNNIRKIAKNAIAFSVRNDESFERLSAQGLTFDEVPDPGFFVDGNHPRPDIDGKYVMLQIAYDAPHKRNVNGQSFIDNMVSICNDLVKRGYTVVLAPHCWTDIEASRLITNAVNNKHVFMWNWFSIIREENITVGLGYYKYASFVIAMRGHAQICPIGMGVPVISIINHPKHLGILRKIDQTNLSISVNEEQLPVKILTMVKFVEKHTHKIKKEYKNLMDDLTEQTRLWISGVYKKYSQWLYNNPHISKEQKTRLKNLISPITDNKK